MARERDRDTQRGTETERDQERQKENTEVGRKVSKFFDVTARERKEAEEKVVRTGLTAHGQLHPRGLGPPVPSLNPSSVDSQTSDRTDNGNPLH